jgi:PAS domain S-box-containing protein
MLSSDLVRHVLDFAPDALIIIDGAGCIVFANRQVETLFGYPPAELVGQTVELLLPERFRTRHVDHRHGYARSLRVRPMGSGLDLFARRRDGSEFPVEISLSPASDGPRTLVVAAIRDITERRQFQNALRDAREAADRANQAKSRFLATASHDLRQPLQALSLLNGTLRKMITAEPAAEALAQQEQAICAMSRLLNALLDISKLESGAIRPELTDFGIGTLLNEIRTEFSALARSKGLALEVPSSSDLVHSDMALLGQVLRNLVINAIKYTEAGTVSIRCARENKLVRLQVIDTGVGIPAAELAHIYDDFYQIGVSPNTSRDGYGLGLSIVSRIVMLLGLKLDVQSEVGKGTVFTLLLPASEPRPDGSVPAQAPGPASECASGVRMPVLLVEDDARVRKATRMFLTAEGYDVTAVGSFEEAAAAAEARKDLCLLITDYHLGRHQTGVQVIDAVRGKLGRELPAILITGDTSSAVRELRGDGSLRTASKPINPDELLNLMRSLTGAEHAP